MGPKCYFYISIFSIQSVSLTNRPNAHPQVCIITLRKAFCLSKGVFTIYRLQLYCCIYSTDKYEISLPFVLFVGLTTTSKKTFPSRADFTLSVLDKLRLSRITILLQVWVFRLSFLMRLIGSSTASKTSTRSRHGRNAMSGDVLGI